MRAKRFDVSNDAIVASEGNLGVASDYPRFGLSSIKCGTRKARLGEKTANASRNRLGTSGGFLDLDFLRLGFGRLGNRDLQNAV
jgi:hypothetical protein